MIGYRSICLGTIAALVAPSTAFAVPLQFAHQGRLLDAEQAPLEGQHDLHFGLYDADQDGTLLWDETVTESFTGGFYSTVLGADDGNPLDDGIFATPPVYLELTVDGGDPLLPRHEINSVPFALRAGTAENLDGGYVDASDVSIDGELVIDADGNWVGPTPAVDWGDLSGIPGGLLDGEDADVLGGMSCSDGFVAKYDLGSGLWACGADDVLDAAGVLAFVDGAVINLGTGSSMAGSTLATLDDLAADTLAGLACADGGVAKYDSSSGLWGCDTDLVLDSGDVLGMVTGATIDLGLGSSIDGAEIATVDDLDWSLLSGLPPGLADDIDNDLMADLGPLCADGDRAAWDVGLGDWACAPEVVGLDRLETAGAVTDQVLTFDGVGVSWLDGAAGEGCTLIAAEPGVEGALFDCDGEEVRLRTRMGFQVVTVGQSHACGLKLNGEIECWGMSAYGRLDAPAGTFTALSAGYNHSCALATDGSLACWGQDSWGQATPPSGTFTAITTGGSHSCAVADTTAVHCWGYDANGQATPPAGSFSSVSAGFQHTCGIRTDGSVECWGAGAAATPSVATATALDSSAGSTCAIGSTGTITCWGDLNCCFPAPSGSFTDVAAGTDSACAVSAVDGSVVCWGTDQAGETSPPPVSFTDLDAELSSSTTPVFTCGVVASTQTVACWGSTTYGVTLPP